MSADIVNMQMYIQHGKPFPKKLKIKGIATTDKLLGYKDYTSRDSSREGNGYNLNIDDNGYFGYTSRESSRELEKNASNIRTYTNYGWIDTAEKRKSFKDEIRSCFSKNGDICWMPVQSFKDYITAEQYGLFSEDDYAALISKTLPKFLKECDLDPENVIWWMDYHTNKSHPHTHLVFTEKIKTRENPMLPMKALNNFKKSMFAEALNRLNIINGIDVKTIFKEKDILNKQVKQKIDLKYLYKQESEIEYSINRLLKKLDGAEGKRLQYNSFHMDPYRSEIDEIVSKILRHPSVSDIYEKFLNECRKIDSISSSKLNTVFTNIEDSETSKIRSHIGNQILKFKKDGIDSKKLAGKLDELILTEEINKDKENLNAEFYTEAQGEVEKYSQNVKDAIIMSKINSDLENNDLSAINDLKEQVRQGNPYAMAKYGGLLMKGMYIEKNIDVGIFYIKRAALIGNKSALGFIEFYENLNYKKHLEKSSNQKYENIKITNYLKDSFVYDNKKHLNILLKGSRSSVNNGFRSVERKMKKLVEDYLEDNENEIYK